MTPVNLKVSFYPITFAFIFVRFFLAWLIVRYGMGVDYWNNFLWIVLLFVVFSTTLRMKGR